MTTINSEIRYCVDVEAGVFLFLDGDSWYEVDRSEVPRDILAAAYRRQAEDLERGAWTFRRLLGELIAETPESTLPTTAGDDLYYRMRLSSTGPRCPECRSADIELRAEGDDMPWVNGECKTCNCTWRVPGFAPFTRDEEEFSR